MLSNRTTHTKAQEDRNSCIHHSLRRPSSAQSIQCGFVASAAMSAGRKGIQKCEHEVFRGMSSSQMPAHFGDNLLKNVTLRESTCVPLTLMSTPT